MYWGRQFKFAEFVTQVRCTDFWFQGVLQEFRHGRFSEEIYNFLHDYPMHHTGTWLSGRERASCENARCDAIDAEILRSELYSARAAGQFWEDMRSCECAL